MNWLVKLSFPSMNTPVPKISLQEAHDTCNMEIGELFHGTTSETLDLINERGFSYEMGESYSGNTSHGFDPTAKHGDCPLPVHYLGYGVYFTQRKNIAQNYGFSIGKGYYLLKNARYDVINFHALNTIMNKFWIPNGYDCELAKKDRVGATKLMTEQLRTKYDFVVQTGKSFGGGYRGGDGNQVCVYDMGIIRQVDKKLTQPGEIGSRVEKISDNHLNYDTGIPVGMKGRLIGRRPIDPEASKRFHNGEKEFLIVKWTRGGTDHNVYPSEVKFI